QERSADRRADKFADVSGKLLVKHGFAVVAVHAGDVVHTDFLRAGGLALVLVRAVPKTFGVHLTHHREHALVAFRLALRKVPEMRDLRGGEQHRGGVFASGDTGPATNAGGGIEGAIGILLWNG